MKNVVAAVAVVNDSRSLSFADPSVDQQNLALTMQQRQQKQQQQQQKQRQQQ